MRIEPVSYDALDACAEVIRSSFLTVADEFGLTERNCPTNGAFLKPERLQNEFRNGFLMFGCFEADALVGYVQLEPKDASLLILEKLAVVPRARHKGYGRELVALCRHKATELGYHTLSIAIIEENTQLKQWYFGLGFDHTGTRKFEHLPFTVGFMELRIK